MGVKVIKGRYEEGRLCGQGRVVMVDDTVRQAWFQHGCMHGPARWGGLSEGWLMYT